MNIVANFCNKMAAININLSDSLHRAGLRATPQRLSIFTAALAGNGHSTIEEIYKRARLLDPGINLATIYRNLNLLCELRQLVAADIGGGKWVYEPAAEKPHHHLVCRTCGQVETIRQEEVQNLVDEVSRDHNFTIDMGHMAFFGLCKICTGNSEGAKDA